MIEINKSNDWDWDLIPEDLDRETLKEILVALYTMDKYEFNESKVIFPEDKEEVEIENILIPEVEFEGKDYTIKTYIESDFGDGIVVCRRK